MNNSMKTFLKMRKALRTNGGSTYRPYYSPAQAITTAGGQKFYKTVLDEPCGIGMSSKWTLSGSVIIFLTVLDNA
jgi:hypothetical protein